MLYHLLKAIHLLGVVLLVGNVIVTLVWKRRADRTGDPSVIAFGQRLVSLTDWWFTLGGVILILVGGFGAAWRAGLDLFGLPWLLWGQVLFGVSGLLWASILIPAQIRQARQARAFATTGVIPKSYWRKLLARRAPLDLMGHPGHSAALGGNLDHDCKTQRCRPKRDGAGKSDLNRPQSDEALRHV
ncbi:DUF2269 family protein [Rhabdochromatium marinum]|uniref:DUF2269 family protein n=1 Tax=Rhabdochromatium marinum TaxID=48729 RepID=UPI001F5B40DE|nr:DUF2269 domain-containing protein [Rhabdochromatium marinum]